MKWGNASGDKVQDLRDYVSVFLTEAHDFWIYKTNFLFFGDDIVSFMTSSNFINSPVCETGE